MKVTKAIFTRYLGPTNYKGSRIKAYRDDTSITVSYKTELSSEENHLEAARAILKHIGRVGSFKFHAGYTPDNSKSFMVFLIKE